MDTIPPASFWLTRARVRLYASALLVCYSIVMLALVIPAHPGERAPIAAVGGDFVAFWSASRLALEGRAEAAYDPSAIAQVEFAQVPEKNEPITWQYPPTFFLAVLPLALLPWLISFGLFSLATAAGFLAAMHRVLPSRDLWLPLLAFPACFLNLVQGQNGFLTTALVTAALLSLDRRPIVSGLLFGLLAIKPHLAILVPLALVAGRHWRALVSTALTAGIFLGVSVLVLGNGVLKGFVHQIPVVAGWMAEGRLPLLKIPSLFAFARSMGASADLAYVMQSGSALLCGTAVIWTFRTEKDVALRAPVLLTATLLTTPYIFDYDLLWLAPALAWFAHWGLRRGWHLGERTMIVLLWLLPLEMLLQSLLKIAPQPAPWLLLGFLILALMRVRVHSRTDSISMPQPMTAW